MPRASIGVAGAKAVRVLGHPLLHCIGDDGRDSGAGTGNDADNIADERAADHVAHMRFHQPELARNAGDILHRCCRLIRCLQHAQHLGQGKQTYQGRHEWNPAEEAVIENKARQPVDRVRADGGQK
jgi:hypothetical protein